MQLIFTFFSSFSEGGPFISKDAHRVFVSLWVSLLLLLANPLHAQLPPNQPEQDCFFAIPVCQDTYIQTNSYSGEGLNSDEINGRNSCMLIGERNSVWYTFTIRQAGNLCFTIIPQDTLDDYDWALFDLTTATCGDIPNNPALEVRCNWAYNQGCQGETGANGRTDCPDQFEACIPVLVGQKFVLNVSNFTASNSGYTLDFSQSSARLYDDIPPQVESVTSFCTGVRVRFDENVLCSTIDSLDFVFTGPGGPYTIYRVSSPNCDRGGAYDRDFDFYLSPGIPTAGWYTLTLAGSVTDFCGNVAPPVTKQVYMPMPPIASIEPPGPAQCIEENDFILTYSGPSSVRFYAWNLGDSTLSIRQQPRKTYKKPGTRTVELIITDVNGCKDTATTQLTVLGNPATQFQLPATACQRDSLTPVNLTTAGAGSAITGYRWFFGDGGYTTDPNPTYYYAPSGDFEVVLAVTNQDGCVGQYSQWLRVFPTPETDFAKEEDLCLGDSAHFINLSTIPSSQHNDLIVSWSWNFGNGATQGMVPQPVVLYDSAGTYPVVLRVVSDKGCVDSLVQQMVIHQPAPPLVKGDSTCIGEPALLSAVPQEDGAMVSWYTAAGDTAVLHHMYSFFTPPLTETRIYFVEVTSEIGCVSERVAATALVPPLQNGRIAAMDSILFFPQPLAQLSLEGSYQPVTYYWTFGDGITSEDPEPAHEYEKPGRYDIGLAFIDIYGCRHTLSRYLDVMRPTDVFVPSAFTPNGDGINDLFSIATPALLVFRFQVFDRFGRMLFESSQPDFLWDGRTEGGKDLPEGVYAFAVDAVDVSGDPVQFAGTITLFR